MKITITSEGRYQNGAWVCTSVEARDDDDQTYAIELDSDETYCVTSNLHGDEEDQIVGGVTFEKAWLGLAEAFGVTSL